MLQKNKTSVKAEKNNESSNADKIVEEMFPNKNKIDITIVVDMLLTGFDSKYLNTLYVDKNLKYHGIQNIRKYRTIR